MLISTGNKVFICIGRTWKSCMKLSSPEHTFETPIAILGKDYDVTPHIKPDQRHSSLLLHILHLVPPDDIKESEFSVEVSPATWRLPGYEKAYCRLYSGCVPCTMAIK